MSKSPPDKAENRKDLSWQVTVSGRISSIKKPVKMPNAANFVHQGYLVFEPGVDEDALMEAALEAGAEDVIANDDGSIEVITAPNDWAGVKAALEAAGYKSVDGDVTMRAQNETELSGDDAVKMQKLIDALEDLDDVQDVYTSAVLNLD